MRPISPLPAVLLIVGCAPAIAASASLRCTLDRATGTTVDQQPFLLRAYGTRWNLASNRLAFMQPDASGYYQVFTANPNGGDRSNLTAARAGLPAKHHGTPSWHPSGRYLLFVAQKQEWHGLRLFGVPDYEALPGFGRHDDLWVTAADGSGLWRLTNDADTRDEGVLLPVFSPDGQHIAWSARQPGGKYVLVVAEFVEQPEPHVQHLRRYQPGDGSYYEPGSFTSDSASLVYSSDQDTHSFWRSQIYRLDLASGESYRLTTGRDYNEHPIVIGTPTGDWIVYMSTREVDRYPWQLFLGTDWYAVKLDGSDSKRLTRMNVKRKLNPQNAGYMQVAGTVAISPTGDFMLGDVQNNLLKQTGLVRVVHFTCPEGQ
jgi:Tol biopolymer transport system component